MIWEWIFSCTFSKHAWVQGICLSRQISFWNESHKICSIGMPSLLMKTCLFMLYRKFRNSSSGIENTLWWMMYCISPIAFSQKANKLVRCTGKWSISQGKKMHRWIFVPRKCDPAENHSYVRNSMPLNLSNQLQYMPRTVRRMLEGRTLQPANRCLFTAVFGLIYDVWVVKDQPLIGGVRILRSSKWLPNLKPPEKLAEDRPFTLCRHFSWVAPNCVLEWPSGDATKGTAVN